MRYLMFFVAVLLSSCGGDTSKQENKFDSHIGSWKTNCFTGDRVDYWIETTYVIEKSHLVQKVDVFDNENCDAGVALADTNGLYTYSKSVITTSGIEVQIFKATWFYDGGDDKGSESELGFYIDNDALYLVHSYSTSGQYVIDFEVPFYKMM